MIFFDKLANGIRVVSESMPSFRSVSLGVWVAAGSVNERSEQGASHFIEHMLFKGTKRRSATDIAAEMDALGGNLNAFTAKECTCYYAKVLGEHMEKAADMLCDIVLNSLFNPEDVEREKGVVSEEILMMEDSPEDLAHEALCSAMYGGSPLALPILGTLESVSGFTREALLAYMQRRYTAENVVIACAGNFNRQRLLEILNSSFGALPSGQDGPAPKSVLKAERSTVCIQKDIEQVHICLGLPGYPTDSDGMYPLFVLNNVLGGSMSSRLFQAIREEKGLAYSVYSYPSSYADTGYFTLYAGTGEKQAKTVLELMLLELERLRKEGITAQELQRGKEQLKGSYMLGQESTSARANSLGKSYLTLGRTYTEQETIGRIEAVDMQSIEAILPHVLNMGALGAAFVGRSAQNELQKVLAGQAWAKA